ARDIDSLLRVGARRHRLLVQRPERLVPPRHRRQLARRGATVEQLAHAFSLQFSDGYGLARQVVAGRGEELVDEHEPAVDRRQQRAVAIGRRRERGGEPGSFLVEDGDDAGRRRESRGCFGVERGAAADQERVVDDAGVRFAFDVALGDVAEGRTAVPAHDRALLVHRGRHAELAPALAPRGDFASAAATILAVGVAAALEAFFGAGAEPYVAADVAGDAHRLAQTLDGGRVALLRFGGELGGGVPVRRQQLGVQQHFAGGRGKPPVVVATAAAGVGDAPSRVDPVGGFVQEHLEHLGGREVQRLAGEQDFTAGLAVGDPPAAPPVTELDEPAALDAAAEDHDDVGQVGVMGLDVAPRLLAGAYDRAAAGFAQLDRLLVVRVRVRLGNRQRGHRRVAVRWRKLVEQLTLDQVAVGLDPVPHLARRQPERAVVELGDDVGGEAQVDGRRGDLADLAADDRAGEIGGAGVVRAPVEVIGPAALGVVDELDGSGRVLGGLELGDDLVLAGDGGGAAAFVVVADGAVAAELHELV